VEASSPKDKFFDTLLHIILLNMAGKGKAKGRGRPKKVVPVVEKEKGTPTVVVEKVLEKVVEKVDSGEGRKSDLDHVDSGPGMAPDSEKSKKARVSKKAKRKSDDS
jgi:hypothetical protein